MDGKTVEKNSGESFLKEISYETQQRKNTYILPNSISQDSQTELPPPTIIIERATPPVPINIPSSDQSDKVSVHKPPNVSQNTEKGQISNLEEKCNSPEDLFVPFKQENKLFISKSNSLYLYIDSVRLLPDNAISCKIVGKICNLPCGDESKAFYTFPEYSSSFRNPLFDSSKIINVEKKDIPVTAFLLLKLYSIDR